MGVVEFYRGSFVVRAINRDMMQNLYEIDEQYLKVLGNRFENPELLTVQKSVVKKKSNPEDQHTSHKVNKDFVFGK